jgi:flagellar biosynthesis protein FlhA
VTAGSLVVGFIIFIIVIVIQFVVITKGAGRIAEVAARFTLDGLPGKQMAIDADLNTGLIDEREARIRREQVAEEADFYGAMDGASKFVRGDAVAGLIITAVNIFGGLIVGMFQHNMRFTECLNVFTRLTIGDGLVAAIPAFIVAVGAGMLVTRSSSKVNLGEDLLAQLTAKPIVLLLTAVFLCLLALTDMPMLPLLLLAVGCGGLAFLLIQTRKAAIARADQTKARSPESEQVESLLGVEPVELEIGVGLIRLVDGQQGGDLLERIADMRRRIAAELGIVVPPIRVRDNLKLQTNEYVVKLRGVQVAGGECIPDYWLALDNGTADSTIAGAAAVEPVFGLPACWIAPEQKIEAEQHNYTVVSASVAVVTHLTDIIRQHADTFLTRQQTYSLLERLKEKSPKAVEELIPDTIKVGDLQRVLQNLLREGIPIRDLETILEAVCEWAGRTKDPDVLTEYARHGLAGTICQLYKDGSNRICAMALDPAIEDLIGAHVEQNDRGTCLNLPPKTQNSLVLAVKERMEQAVAQADGQTVVLVCSPQVRLPVRRLIEPVLPHVPVLALNEMVKDVEVQSLGLVVFADEFEKVPG